MSTGETSEVEVGRLLLEVARGTLVADLTGRPMSLPTASWLGQPGACFVTLHRGGELRGCIGTIQAHRPLVEDVQKNARAAAFDDPRFPSLEAAELTGLSLEVSLLSDPEPMDFRSEEDLIRQMRPGVDGLILEHGYHRGTFLPAVWRSLPEAELFLRHLKTKAGLPEDFWSPEIVVHRYTARSWSDSEPQD